VNFALQWIKIIKVVSIEAQSTVNGVIYLVSETNGRGTVEGSPG
jgi:hypothetical protein